MSLWKAHLEYWGGTSISLTSTRLPRRSLCCKSGFKNQILDKVSLLGNSWRTENRNFPRQLHGAARGFSFPLAEREINFVGPRRTKSRQCNWHILDDPLFHNIWSSHPWPWCCFNSMVATMIPSLTDFFGSATAQDNPIPTSTQINHDLTCACCPYKTPRSVNGTWRDAIGDGHRLREHCQAGLREEISLCKVRAPNKILCTCSFLMVTQSRLIINDSPWVAGPRITSAFNWNTWNITVFWAIESPHMQRQCNIYQWIGCMLYTGAAKRGNQPA